MKIEGIPEDIHCRSCSDERVDPESGDVARFTGYHGYRGVSWVICHSAWQNYSAEVGKNDRGGTCFPAHPGTTKECTVESPGKHRPDCSQGSWRSSG